MVKVLVVSDEVDSRLTLERIKEMGPRLVISCGDLPRDYLDFVSSAANAPLVYVPGNHDPAAQSRPEPAADPAMSTDPPGMSLDRRVVTEFGLRIAGLGGSIRYREGPNQYTQSQMRRRVKSVIRTSRVWGLGPVHSIDIFVAHAPPYGVGDDVDTAHVGFEAFHHLIEVLRPRLMVHGHIHPYGFPRPDRVVGQTRIVNVVPHKLLEIDGT